MKNKKTLLVILGIIIVVVFAGILGLTYAWFTGTVEGGDQTVDITAAGSVGLIYTEVTPLSLSTASPGTTATGKFTIANTKANPVSQSYDITMIIDANTFTSTSNATASDPVTGNNIDPTKQLVMTITQSDNTKDLGPETSSLLNKTINNGTAVATLDYLADGSTYKANYAIKIAEDQVIDANATQTYDIALLFKNLRINQNNNLGANFRAHFVVDNVKADSVITTASQALTYLGITPKNGTPSYNVIVPQPVYEAQTADGTLNATANTAYYYTYASEYTITPNTGKLALKNPLVTEYSSGKENLIGKYLVSPDGANSSTVAGYTNLTTIYEVIEASNDTITYKTISGVKTGYDHSEDGVFSMEDDLGTSYYFRGGVSNNYVYFANKYWRIIRINGDGTLRVIYDGTSAWENGVSNTNRLALTGQPWNSSYYNDAKYVGYMYGGANGTASTTRETDRTSANYALSSNAVYNETNSNIKTRLDDWYVANIKTPGYSEYVADEIFCNDRSIYNSGTGIGTSVTYYGARQRNIDRKTPKLKCEDANGNFLLNDAFTVNSSTKGNGDLEYPIGLITADEIALAGGRQDTANYGYYLYKGTWYWAFSPGFGGAYAHVLAVNGAGHLSNYNVYSNGGGDAPVINLNTTFVRQMTGSGTTTDPYRLP